MLPRTRVKRYKCIGLTTQPPPSHSPIRGSQILETSLTSASNDTTLVVEPESIEPDLEPISLVLDPEELAFEIGAWLIGIRSFAASCQPTFAGESRSGEPDLRREFRIVSLALHRLSKLTLRLRRSLDAEQMAAEFGFSRAKFDEFGTIVQNSLILAESQSTARSVSYGEWNSWIGSFIAKVDANDVARSLCEHAVKGSYGTLPVKLRELFEKDEIDVSDRVDYLDVVPRVAAALRFLEVVGRMMRNDEPIKPALLILSAVHDQARTMIDHINLRLARHPNEEAPLFNSLDSASYSASLELKKVFKQELKGIVGVLPPTSVFARTETAYSLLLDSFQQILVDLARTVDGTVTLFDFFPRFQIKLDQSLILREHLWVILNAVKAAEESPETPKVDHLKQELADFVTITIRFLHYKDEETFDRFTEEVHAALDKKDLVPVLHRFGAYLDTLFGQVCMRAVLAENPFHGN